MLTRAPKTDEDLNCEVIDLDKELGGLNKIEVMDNLIEELRQQNQEFVIAMSEESVVKTFQYQFDDKIFTLAEPNE